MTFSADEWEALAGPLRLCSAADAALGLPAAQWLDEALCAERLDALSPVIGSPTRRITASLLGKRLSFLMTGACLYAMSAYDKGLALTLDNTVVDARHDGQVWISTMPLRDLRTSAPSPGQREAWRLNLATLLFAGLLQPLWEVFYRVSGVPRRILWENTAVRVYSLYERRLAKHESPEVRERARADLHWLLAEASNEVFGLSYNPLAHFDRPPTPIPGSDRSVRVRRTCCFYYQASDPVEYCSTCPLICPRPSR